MKKILCLVFVLLIIFSGCGGKNPLTPTDNLKGSVTLAIKASVLMGKTIQPDLDMNIATYDVYGVGPDGVNFRKNDQSSSTVSLEALAGGLWTITVDAKNDEGIIIASGYTDVTVIAGINTSAGVTVTPLTGTGVLRVNLAWPGGTITNPVINATLAPKGGGASDIAFTLSGDNLSAIYEDNAIEAGYYTLLVYLYDGTTFKWGAAEAVRIIKDQTSEGNYPVIPGGGIIGDINLIITPDLQNPLDITFSGAVDNLFIGTNMTVTATVSEEVETYQWYLNGKPLSGETKDTIIIGSALPSGNYRLDLLVAKRMIISSAAINFTVSESGVTHVIAVAGGMYHSAALKNDGTVWTWGANGYGQLGDGTNTDRYSPMQVSGLSGIIAITEGYSFGLALKNDGTVWAWGSNDYGQIGDGTNTNRYLPVQVSGLTGITAIAGGIFHGLALKNDGTVWAWGLNDEGELGDGTNIRRNLPVQVLGLTGVISIVGANGHSLALKNDGTIWAWGLNSYGELGDGTNMDRYLPVQVSGLTGVMAIAGESGSVHSLALKNDGTVWAWGYNSHGQLGDGTAAWRNTPVQVNGLTGVTSVVSGCLYSMALKNDGTVWAWGHNLDGELGDGTNTTQYLPVQVENLTGVAMIAGGGYHDLALKNDGTVWGWGNNSNGQLSDGTLLNRNVPVQVNGL